jgi:hypothetical protein
MHGNNDAVVSSLLLDTSIDPYQLRTNVELQQLFESECNSSTCTAQLTSLRQHSNWTKVSSDVTRGVALYPRCVVALLIICQCIMHMQKYEAAVKDIQPQKSYLTYCCDFREVRRLTQLFFNIDLTL